MDCLTNGDTIVMASFHFRLRFHLPPHQTINCEEAELEIPTEGTQPNLRLKSHVSGESIKSASRLTLSAGPYESNEDALAAGIRARHALMRYSIIYRVGIDLGKNRSEGAMSRCVKDKLASGASIQLIDDVHGLLVYDRMTETKFAYLGGASLTLGNQPSVFLEQLQQAHALRFQPTDKQEVAFELFAAAQFEPSPRSRFLTLVMAIEALMQPVDRDPEVQHHVQSFVDQTKQSNLLDSEKKSLLSSLDWLFKDSIGRTGKLLAEELLAGKDYDGKAPGSFFRHCYDLRSQLVHSGRISDDTVKLGNLAVQLEQFVADLLEASIQPIVT